MVFHPLNVMQISPRCLSVEPVLGGIYVLVLINLFVVDT